MSRDENTYKKDNQDFVSQFKVSLWEHTQSREPCGTIVTNTIDEFVEWLMIAHRRSIQTKADNHLLSPAFFQPDGRQARAASNVQFTTSVWLDIDDGDLTPKRLATLFRHVRMVCFNTFSSTKAQPRWRVFMPTNEPVTLDEYRCITKQIVQVVTDDGFTATKRRVAGHREKAHGIDTGKLSAENLFYLPCQPHDPSGKIWRDFRDDHRQPIIVKDWIQHSVLPREPQRQWHWRSREHDGIDQVRVQDAVAHWRDVAGTGDDNHEFFMLGFWLAVAGMSEAVITLVLNTEAGMANTPADRRRQISSIFTSLRSGYGILR